MEYLKDGGEPTTKGFGELPKYNEIYTEALQHCVELSQLIASTTSVLSLIMCSD